MNLNKNKIAIIVIILVVGTVFGLKLLLGPKLQAAENSENKKLPMKFKGSLDAEYKITEYLDFQCPSCGRASNLISDYMKDHPGKISVELKYFPLRIHHFGFQSAKYAECAGQQGKFWPMHDLIFEDQTIWKDLIRPERYFLEMSSKLELDLDKLGACLEDPKVDEIIQMDRKQGDILGIRQTPTIFINDEMVVGYKAVKKRLDALFGDKN